MDERVDARTLREIYLRPFARAVRDADPWTVMASYPRVNGVHADCSVPLLQHILRDEWGFQGLVMCDWGGLNDTVQSLVAGTDLEMPGPPIRYGAALQAEVEKDASLLKPLDASVRRILGVLDRAGLVGKAEDEVNDESEKDSDLPAFRQTARDAAVGGIVLLKNTNNIILPLDATTIRRLAIIGPNAKTPTTGGSGSASVNPYYITSPLESLTARFKESNPDVEVVYAQGIRCATQPALPGSMLRTPNGKQQGVQVDFYAGWAFEGPVVGTTFWASSAMFMMSDGDTPAVLRGQPHCYRVTGVLTPTTSGVYDISLSNTGRTKLFLDDNLLIDNTHWTEAGGTFMNCGSVNKIAIAELEADRQYTVRIDNIVAPPPLPAHDNTLFHTLSGLRVGFERRIDEEALFAEAVDAARSADAVVVVVGHNNETEKEGVDRLSLSLPGRTDELVTAVCAAGPADRTVVVSQSACAIAMPWANAVPAIVQAWYQGQENGNALADVLLGAANPSGKLPITFPQRLEDHGSHPFFPGDATTDICNYGEGVLVGYRWFNKEDTTPLWPFGFGLSYTTFVVSDVAVTDPLRRCSTTSITANVTNTGSRAGAEVVQVYVSPSATIAAQGKLAAPRSLAGFAKVKVAPGATETVTIEMDEDAVAWFDVDATPAIAAENSASSNWSQVGAWRVDPGRYTCYVGTSSRDFFAEVELVVE
ncbi:hypothetical protein SEUCBS139899_008100 [Sporothrix eucalyptigena]